ncbi:hypothetical protein WK91_12515 [Burkholderia cepacia]|nr:hypothetical protein WK91_12515 [Burkholderia cepacia]
MFDRLSTDSMVPVGYLDIGEGQIIRRWVIGCYLLAITQKFPTQIGHRIVQCFFQGRSVEQLEAMSQRNLQVVRFMRCGRHIKNIEQHVGLAILRQSLALIEDIYTRTATCRDFQ